MKKDCHAREDGHPGPAMDHNRTLIYLIALMSLGDRFAIRKIRVICVLFALERVE